MAPAPVRCACAAPARPRHCREPSTYSRSSCASRSSSATRSPRAGNRVPSVEGGRTLYGYSVGILMLEARFPRIPGDLGNASTFPYPALYHVVHGASPERVVLEADPTLLEPF